MNVPWIDLSIQHRTLRPEINQAINDILDRCDFILGQDVGKFEEEFAAYCGTKYAVGVDSGVSAIELSLRALGVGSGDEVLFQPIHSLPLRLQLRSREPRLFLWMRIQLPGISMFQKSKRRLRQN